MKTFPFVRQVLAFSIHQFIAKIFLAFLDIWCFGQTMGDCSLNEERASMFQKTLHQSFMWYVDQKILMCFSTWILVSVSFNSF